MFDPRGSDPQPFGRRSHWYRRFSLLQRFAVTSFIVFVLLGFGIAYFASQSFESQALASARETAYDSLHNRLLQHLTPADLAKPLTKQRYATFRSFVDNSVLSSSTVRVKIWNRSGRVIYSTDPKIQGRVFPISDELEKALGGGLATEVSDLTKSENKDDRRYGKLLEVYIPIQFSRSGPVSGAFEIYQTYSPIAADIATARMTTFSLVGSGLLVLYLLLFGIVRSGSTMIKTQQQQLKRYTRDLEISYRQTIASLAAAVDARDHSTERHSARVSELCVALGRAIGLSPMELRDLERGALLHDVGKIGIPDAILLKPGKLTDEEWKAMRRHPEIGYQMLRDIDFLEPALPLVRHHHEKWDGSGYPDRLAGEDIPLWARLFAIIDAYDAITADRPYRSGAPHDVAMERIRRDAGTHFDPNLVSAFDAMMGLIVVPTDSPPQIELRAQTA